MNVVIFGGAGYIGSVTALLGQERGWEVIVVDDFSTGHKQYVEGINYIEASILDFETISTIIKENEPDAILNFAAKIQVAESMEQPREYFINNFMGAVNIVQSSIENEVKNFIFSSTAAVYGEPKSVPIKEEDATEPINPYGLSKLLVEQSLRSYSLTHDLNWVAFRYFNAAGAYKNRAMDYPVMTHLIPHAVEAMLKNKKFKLYGDDYPTEDGTCIRDFVHVVDIAKAHIIATEKMVNGTMICQPINLGSGKGYSVMEIIKSFENLTGKPLSYEVNPRRAGDPAVLIADNTKAKELLDWEPELGVEEMIKSHLEWRDDR